MYITSIATVYNFDSYNIRKTGPTFMPTKGDVTIKRYTDYSEENKCDEIDMNFDGIYIMVGDRRYMMTMLRVHLDSDKIIKTWDNVEQKWVELGTLDTNELDSDQNILENLERFLYDISIGD